MHTYFLDFGGIFHTFANLKIMQAEEKRSGDLNALDTDDHVTPVPGGFSVPASSSIVSMVISEITDRSGCSSSPSRSSSGREEVGQHLTPPLVCPKNVDSVLHDEGYDSDGELGPFFDAVEDEDELECNEDELG